MNARTKKVLVSSLLIITGFYVVLCILVYFLQEKLIFFPEKLAKDHEFRFSQPFQEMSFSMDDGKSLSGLLFKADSSKGLIFYLHGNAGSLDSWGEVARFYTDAGYDLLC
ncbi:hypothetical protein [Paraflavitalea speifideaquila]|uniref:hypothetical protein n=1 Tax=Paraflavitalea speifideaquila TaxID=3076558 RepID=UPI0028E6420E|nr:hypothetical protein [Paraflavitalea speifideiaquila]